MSYPVEKSDAEWREELSPDEYAVLRKAGREELPDPCPRTSTAAGG